MYCKHLKGNKKYLEDNKICVPFIAFPDWSEGDVTWLPKNWRGGHITEGHGLWLSKNWKKAHTLRDWRGGHMTDRRGLWLPKNWGGSHMTERRGLWLPKNWRKGCTTEGRGFLKTGGEPASFFSLLQV